MNARSRGKATPRSTPRRGRPRGPRPSVLIFDVNETLLDIESLNPLFQRLFGDERVLREWFGQLVLYSMTLTLAGLYKDFITLGEGAFEMLATIHKAKVSPADLENLKQGMLSMPAHPDVGSGLRKLQAAGFRMVTLTNSPSRPSGKCPLQTAGLAHFFERQFSVETARAFKPASILYHMVAQDLDVAPADCCLIAAHVWDTVGAQSAGLSAGLITRPGNAPLPVRGLPQPDFVAASLPALATKIIKER
ncbi:MAG TPA: haloacid dehalogenase type II [Pirellulales bacterium]|nr:haloacid dehalogenase type II [Pirellulales bacterium]